jgi:hypothetical protein
MALDTADAASSWARTGKLAQYRAKSSQMIGRTIVLIVRFMNASLFDKLGPT